MIRGKEYMIGNKYRLEIGILEIATLATKTDYDIDVS